MTYDLVIRGGLVATVANVAVADLGISAGRIAAVAPDLPANWREIDARGLVVVPGGVDVHTHLDLDLGGMRTADDFESGTAAAACGGITTICDYAWPPPGASLAQTIERWTAKARGKAHIDYGFHVVVSDASDAVLREIPALVAAGFPSLKVFTIREFGLADEALVRVLRAARRAGALVNVHCENSEMLDLAQADMVAAGRTDPRHYAATVANKVLGGGADARLFLILREQKSWTYGASSGLSRRRDVGHFSAGTEVRTPVTDSALVELLSQLERMRTEPVADSELVAAKGYLVGSFPLSIETPQQVASQVSTVKLLGLRDNYLSTYRDRLAAVTAAQVTAAARRVIRPDSAVIVVVGDGAAIHEKLAKIAPVRVVDTDGKPMSPEDLAPRVASPIAFDRAQLVSRRDSFVVTVQGTPFGYMTADLAVSRDSVVYVEETAIAAAGMRQRTLVRLDPATLGTHAVEQTGTMMGQALDIRLTYSGDRVKGRAQTPVPGAAGPKVVEIDTALAAGTMDINAFQPLAAALPLAEGASITIAAFEASESATRTLTAKVGQVQDVIVPAGTFAAFKVELSGGQSPFVMYLSRETPRRLLRVEIVGQPLVFELVK